MTRHWFYLDALKQRHGPLNDAQLAAVLRLDDCLVWAPGMLGWEWAGEFFARPDVAPLADAGVPARPAAAPGRGQGPAVEELLGIVRGVLLDGVVTDGEVLALSDWLAANPDLRHRWPASALSVRIGRVLEDGRVDDEERRDLAALLARALGPQPATPEAAPAELLPAVDDPPPAVMVPGRSFTFAGSFVFGTRSACEAAVVERGGRPLGAVAQGVDYLVIGALHEERCGGATPREAAEAARALRSAGHPIAIVAEERWAAALA